MHGLPVMLRAQPLVMPFSHIPAVASDLRNWHRARTLLMMFESILQVFVVFFFFFNTRTLCLKNKQVGRSLYFPFYLTSSSAVLGQESMGATESSLTCQDRPRVLLLIVAASSGYCASMRMFLIKRSFFGKIRHVFWAYP